MALMGSPFRIAASSGLMNMALMPSPRPYPSAEASKVLHLPSGAKTKLSDIVTDIVGENMILLPPTMAAEQSPEYID